ncbi:MAG: hypothetical protein COA58_11845 [Bacteroidetes bacterium]|nr:MAG: hypothetical protein COA58_11845 [Bacteroidota bacterium]
MSKDKSNNTEAQNTVKSQFVFDKQNYKWMIIGFAVIVLGFILMSGAEGDIDDFRRITLAPIVVIGGFIIEIYAIMKKPK